MTGQSFCKEMDCMIGAYRFKGSFHKVNNIWGFPDDHSLGDNDMQPPVEVLFQLAELLEVDVCDLLVRDQRRDGTP